MKKSSLSLWLTLAFAVSIIYFFDLKEIRFYLVPSDSMEPTLRRSDYIAGFRIEPPELQRGDIIVFSSGREDDFYVKRVVGLPNETLWILNGYTYTNGRRLEEPYVRHRGSANLGPVRIPEDRVFVMGDNRTNSLDSRSFGPVPISLIKARVSFIYNPVSRIGRVG